MLNSKRSRLYIHKWKKMGEQDECEDMKGSKDRRGIEKRGEGE
jgi:hypothetical protein